MVKCILSSQCDVIYGCISCIWVNCLLKLTIDFVLKPFSGFVVCQSCFSVVFLHLTDHIVGFMLTIALYYSLLPENVWGPSPTVGNGQECNTNLCRIWIQHSNFQPHVHLLPQGVRHLIWVLSVVRETRPYYVTQIDWNKKKQTIIPSVLFPISVISPPILFISFTLDIKKLSWDFTWIHAAIQSIVLILPICSKCRHCNQYL